jgi:hypothetical protein
MGTKTESIPNYGNFKRHILNIPVSSLMMEAVHASETSIYFYEITQRCIPEGCYLHIGRCEILKSH